MPLCAIERPWKKNAHEVSCIPEGTYKLAPHHTEHWPDVIELLDVPGRTGILIHPANLASELRGCIAPGMHHGDSLINPMVMGSRAAMAMVLEWHRTGSIELVIRGAYP